MAQDLLIIRSDEGLFDLSFSDHDLAKVDGFESAILSSLLTDSRADESDVQTQEKRRGWYGNIITAGVGRELGSTLWLYEQSRLTTSVVNKIEADAKNALAWMIEDKIIDSMSLSVYTDSGAIFIMVNIVTGGDKNLAYKVLWKDTNGFKI